MSLVFELNDVSFRYQNQNALDRISLKIHAGQHVALLGANGSGKSTLLRLLDALYFPLAGRLSAFGQEVNEQTWADEQINFAFRRRVGLVFQNPDVQLFNPTVLDELAFGPLQLGWPREKILAAIEHSLQQFAISHLKQRAPHHLSGGEKKRVALASVLIMQPEVLLLDEPLAALDPHSAKDVLHFLAASRASGRTLVVATHDLNRVEKIADYVFVLAEGRLVAEGAAHDILANQTLLRQTHLL